jgi:hypothetical protein
MHQKTPFDDLYDILKQHLSKGSCILVEMAENIGTVWLTRADIRIGIQDYMKLVHALTNTDSACLKKVENHLDLEKGYFLRQVK